MAFVKIELERREVYEWVSYTYRHSTEEAQADFGSWIILHNWGSVFNARGSNAKAAAYQRDMDWAMDHFFPLRTTRRKSNDLP